MNVRTWVIFLFCRDSLIGVDAGGLIPSNQQQLVSDEEIFFLSGKSWKRKFLHISGCEFLPKKFYFPFQHHRNLANHDMSHESNYDEKMIIELEEEKYKNGYDNRMIIDGEESRPVIAVTGRPKSLQELTFRKSRF